MNFELIDNCFQIIMLAIGAIVTGIFAFCKRDKRLTILALGYTCFSMGTAYFLLHIAIMGDIPHVSYVSELSWLASYFFFLSLLIIRMEGKRLRFSIVGLLGASWVVWKVFYFHMFGPSVLATAIFAGSQAALFYLAISRIRERKILDVIVLAVIILQLSVYALSAFMEDFTRFNSYYAVDILLTLCLLAMLPALLREVRE